MLFCVYIKQDNGINSFMAKKSEKEKLLWLTILAIPFWETT